MNRRIQIGLGVAVVGVMVGIVGGGVIALLVLLAGLAVLANGLIWPDDKKADSA